MATELRGRTQPPEEIQWLPIADLMAGLMTVFLFVAIVLMRNVYLQRDQMAVERDRIKDVVIAWEETQDDVYKALNEEFRDDLIAWNAELDRTTLTMRFREPEVLFKTQQAAITERFQRILDDFFPRYVARLAPFRECPKEGTMDPRGCIEEIRIEGHTSSEWTGAASDADAYFLNMELSQGRTRSVLQYCMGLVRDEEHPWLRSSIAAVGFSSAHPVDAEGKLLLRGQDGEDPARSRRVEFRVKTTVEKQLIKVIQPE